MTPLRWFVTAALLGVPFAVHATLVQAWSKTINYGGQPVSFIDCGVDASASVFGIGSVIVSGQSDVLVTKVSQTGSTLWTNRVNLAGDQFASRIVVDPSGDVFISYQDMAAFNSDAFVKRLRGTDGATLWTHSIKTPLHDIPFGLHLDGLGQLFLVWYQTNNYKEEAAVTIINQAALNTSVTRKLTFPAGQNLLRSFARPAGGVFVALANRDSTPGGLLEGTSYTSGLYHLSAGNVLAPPVPMGYASVFAIDKLTDKIYSGGIALPTAASFTTCWHTRTPFGGQQEFSHTLNLTNPRYRDATFTKNGYLQIAGSFDYGAPDFQEPSWFWIEQQGLNMNITRLVSPAANDSLAFIGADNFGGLFGTSDGSPQSAIFEMDAILRTQVDTKLIPYRVTTQFVSPFGPIGTAGAGGGLSLFKPRDLKDIYMGSTQYTGGASATAIVRMYQPHTAVRTVALTKSGQNLGMPTSKDIIIGATSASFTVTTLPVGAPQECFIKATLAGSTRTFSFTVVP